jgi:hypothetical protein
MQLPGYCGFKLDDFIRFHLSPFGTERFRSENSEIMNEGAFETYRKALIKCIPNRGLG